MTAGPRRIVRKPKARRDIVNIASFIALDPLAAERFLEAVEVTLYALARLPRMGSSRKFRRPSLAELRMWPIKGFETLSSTSRCWTELMSFGLSMGLDTSRDFLPDNTR